MSDMTHTLGTLTPSPEPHPSHAGPLLSAPRQGSGVPSVCEALTDRLALASVFDVDIEVREALATPGEWLRGGEFGSEAVAAWLVGVHRDVQL